MGSIESTMTYGLVTTRRPVKWEEINFPTTWTLDSVISPSQITNVVTNSTYSHITQISNDRICVQFDDKSVPYNRHSFYDRRWSAIQHISPIEHVYGPTRNRAASLHTIPSIISADQNNKQFYETCALHNQIMYVVPWFITTYLTLYINVLERSYKDGSDNIIKVVYPPQSSFILPNNTSITFTAFQKFVEEDVAVVNINEINNLISKNNYLGLYVKAPEIQDLKFKSLNYLKELLDKKFSGLTAKAIDLSDNFVDEMENTFDFKNHVSLEFNKLRGYPKKNINTKYAHKPCMHTYYYSRSTPQDVGSKIYEWNLDGLTDRKLTIFVHRMLMYATICKSVKNTDRNIYKMIIADFTSQLRGW
ncbi:hypothetical protein H5410_015022 [Solanum commersonii]|uniref:DUF7746 domain-containing protein n=1 Tax=Solanum commersonii TaxID=4109 RepID=A0A9J5ZSJ6_SOLCO|nr:hypothetical protein H5410_015022 [Solanum commersonii]